MNLEVFKFGGASVKDAASIKNVANIIQHHASRPLLVVVSALGKTTNALENMLQAKIKNEDWKPFLIDLQQHHATILQQLNLPTNLLESLFIELEKKIEVVGKLQYDFHYDQIVSFGEMLSTSIVATYLNQRNNNTVLLDARTLIATDNNYRDVNILWKETEKQVTENVLPQLQNNKIVLTQGFIGSTKDGFSTTLGREGSDYSASIFSYCLDAELMTIWKDVNGVMNADPKQFSDAEVIPQLSYYEAIEMTFYGAKVIHPKTIKPLQNKHIQLMVRSFIDSKTEGTKIFETNLHISYPPVKVWKENQVLVSIQTRDFSFIGEKHLQKIFEVLATFRISMNVMQNGAISFSCCVDSNPRLEAALDVLHQEFKILTNENLHLATIRHYDEKTIADLTKGKEILVEQKSRHTIQFVLK